MLRYHRGIYITGNFKLKLINTCMVKSKITTIRILKTVPLHTYIDVYFSAHFTLLQKKVRISIGAYFILVFQKYMSDSKL